MSKLKFYICIDEYLIRFNIHFSHALYIHRRFQETYSVILYIIKDCDTNIFAHNTIYINQTANAEAVLFCFVLFCFVLFCFVLFCFVLFCFVLFCFVLFCFVLFCFVLFCFVLFWFVLFCFVLFCLVVH